jgi:hypothetical protein
MAGFMANMRILAPDPARPAITASSLILGPASAPTDLSLQDASMSPVNPSDRKSGAAAAGRPSKPPPSVGSSDLASALIRFSQRLATFGLGEVTDPLLDDLGDTANKAQPSR